MAFLHREANMSSPSFIYESDTGSDERYVHYSSARIVY